jgi:3-oxoadipate enol-lactonase
MNYIPVQLYYEEQGAGFPVFLLHGFPLDHTTWDKVTESLKSKARVILPDLRGLGKSPVVDGVYQMREMAEDIVALMDKLKIEKAILVGHSMGGYVSLAFAHAYPHRLAGLGLVCTQAANDSPEKRQARLITVDEVKRRGVKVMAQKQANKMSDKPEVIQWCYDIIMKTDKKGVIGCLKGMAERPDCTGYLANIQVPAVVVSGKFDKAVPAEQPQIMTQLLLRGWHVEAANTGHMPMIEEPQVVTQALLQLIELVKN